MSESSNGGSEYVPSEENEGGFTFGPKRLRSNKKKNKRVTKQRRDQSTKIQLSDRKRPTSRISPPVDKKGSPRVEARAKKQKIQKTQNAFQLTVNGEEAVRLVDAEIFKLPDESELYFSVLEHSGTVHGFQNAQVPELHGQKPAPKGQEECLTGKTFTMTGVLESLTRDEATGLIRQHGGRVTHNVSGKTTFLLVGKDSGPAKCEKARGMEKTFIDENGLFQLIRAADRSLFPSAPEPSSERKHEQATAAPIDAASYLGQDLWVDKYKPESFDEIVGNNSTIAYVRDWLESWRSLYLLGQDAPLGPIPGTSRLVDIKSKRALLLCGSPGVGKTTAAYLAAKEAGFEAVEVNASDTRNQADKRGTKGIAGKTANRIRVLCQNNALFSTTSKPLLLIMDEVDGMSSGDRGGVVDLIANIKTTKIPIICICNDKYNPKLKSLRNHCVELDFKRPSRAQISKRLLYICEQEGLQFTSQTAMEELIDEAHGDARTLIGGLQFIRAQTDVLSFNDVKSGKYTVLKNHDVGPFEACRSLLSMETVFTPWPELTEMVFGDSDLIPLLIQENYVNHAPRQATTNKQRMQAIAKAASYLSFGERINAAVRGEQKWSLMPSVVHMGSLAPASVMRGRREVFAPHEMNFPRFTAFMGNLSTGNKQKRLLQSAVTRMSSQQRYSIDQEAAVLDYLPALRRRLTQPLIDNESEGVPLVVEMMKAYCVDKCEIHSELLRSCCREHYDFVMNVVQFKGEGSWSDDPLQSIPAKVKGLLTRTVNAAAFTCPSLPSEAITSKTTVKAEETPEDTPAVNPETGVIHEAIKQEEEEEDVNEEELMMGMKASGYDLKLPAKRKSAASTSRGRGRGRRGSGRRKT